MPTLTQSQMQMYASAAGLPSPAKWAAIGMAESGGRTDKVNGIGCVGWLQINQPVWVQSHPTWTVAYLKDPLHNAQAAKIVYDAQGFSAWQSYTGPDGVGNNGPWQQYYSSDSGTTITQANWVPDWLNKTLAAPFDLLDGNGNPLTAIPGVGTADDVFKAVIKAGEWISTPYNWVRIGFVVSGIVIGVIGLNLIVQSTILKGVGKSGLIDAIPYGSQAKKALSKVGKGKANGGSTTGDKGSSTDGGKSAD